MEEKTTSIEVKCPVCGRNEKISVPESLYSRKKMGLIKVEVPSGAVCPDHFLIFIDSKGIVRGYEKIEIPLRERYRMCGNGVVSKMIPHLLSNIKK